MISSLFPKNTHTTYHTCLPFCTLYTLCIDCDNRYVNKPISNIKTMEKSFNAFRTYAAATLLEIAYCRTWKSFPPFSNSNWITTFQIDCPRN